MSDPVNFDAVQIGEQLPPFVRTTQFQAWNRYAAVNDEFVDIHMDDRAGIRAGNAEGAFGMGNLRYAYIVNALRDWAGEQMEIRRIECQFRALNCKGDTLTVSGTIQNDATDDGVRERTLAIDVINQRSESTCPGTATIAVPAG